MRFTKIQLKYFLAAVSLFTALHYNSYAGGFPVRPKSLLLNPSISYFFANKGWDSLRVKQPYPLNGQFTAVTFSLYAEYGISRRFAFVALLPYTMSTYQQTDFRSTANGLADMETGIRYYLANIDYTYYFTVQGTVITPLYTNPNLGYGLTGAELKFSFAGRGQLFGKYCFFTLEDAVRQYFGSTGPQQNRYNITTGLTLDKKFKHQLSVSLGGIYSTSSFTKFFPNPAVNKNFAFNQVSLSYGYSFNRDLSIFLTGGTFVSGRNTGDGTNAAVSVIIKPF